MTVESQSAALLLLQRLSVPEMVSRLSADPANMARLAKLLLDGGEKERAVDLATEARRLAPVDLLLSEIVSDDLLGEDVLGCLEDAIGRLTRPDARIIPSHGAVRIALAHYGNLTRKQFGSVQGFDLSPMNRLGGRIALSPGNEAPELRSEPADLFAFDFSSGGSLHQSPRVDRPDKHRGRGERHRPVDLAPDGCRRHL